MSVELESNIIPQGKNGGLEEKIRERLEELQIEPNEILGQHFLIDEHPIDLLAQSASSESTVIEIGAGTGQLTEALAQKAAKVISLEIDRRYEPILTKIEQQYPNVQIIFKDALALNFERLIPKHKRGRRARNVQIIASLPFHITEPFLHKIVDLPIESATLVVGERLAREIQAPSEESSDFGRLTLLTQTFFEISVIDIIEKDKFFPKPRTNSAIIGFIPKKEDEFRINQSAFLLRKLFLTSERHPSVRHCLIENLAEYAATSKKGTLSRREYARHQRRLVRQHLNRLVRESSAGFQGASRGITIPEENNQLIQNPAGIVERMEIPESILDKPFSQLNNIELKILSMALKQAFH